MPNANPPRPRCRAQCPTCRLLDEKEAEARAEAEREAE